MKESKKESNNILEMLLNKDVNSLVINYLAEDVLFGDDEYYRNKWQKVDNALKSKKVIWQAMDDDQLTKILKELLPDEPEGYMKQQK